MPLPSAEMTLGSSPDSGFVVAFPGVSRSHARVIPARGGLLLLDVGSKNGIVAGGRRYREFLLSEETAARLGQAVLTIEEGSSSDVILGVRAAVVPQPGSGRDTSIGGGGDPSPAAALAVVRTIERLGPRIHGRRRTTILGYARGALDASALVLGERGRDGDVVVSAYAGNVADAALEAATAGETPKRNSVDVHRRRVGAAEALVARRGAQFVVALFAAEVVPETWHADLFGFVAEKLLRADTSAGVEIDDAPGGDLALAPGMVAGDSPAMQVLLAGVRTAVQGNLDVLIGGETGSGKELLARTIHLSGGARGEFVAVNCAAIPSELLEAELFGVERRVATGVDPRRGLFQRANGGTMFLDEIGEMPERLQVKILRVLQEREILPIGASRPTPLDLRVIAASNRDLGHLAREGSFRPDLYYRLRGIELRVPPLRERPEDIPQLALHFLERAAAEYRKKVTGITRRALDLLRAHDWPGNVRELESDVRHAVLVCPNGAALDSRHFVRSPAGGGDSSPERSLQDAVDDVERREIQRALSAAGGNKSHAARILGITRNGLTLKLRRLGLHDK